MYVLSMYITGSLSLLAFELFYFHYMFNTRQTEAYTECCSYILHIGADWYSLCSAML